MKDANQKLFNAAKKVIPGGVNSPVRAYKAVGGTPVFIDHAHGAYIYDTDGKEYIDYVCSWGPMILGHAEPMVVAAVQAAAGQGLRSWGWMCTRFVRSRALERGRLRFDGPARGRREVPGQARDGFPAGVNGELTLTL